MRADFYIPLLENALASGGELPVLLESPGGMQITSAPRDPAAAVARVRTICAANPATSVLTFAAVFETEAATRCIVFVVDPDAVIPYTLDAGKLVVDAEIASALAPLCTVVAPWLSQ